MYSASLFRIVREIDNFIDINRQGVPKRRLERRPNSFGASKFKICPEGKRDLILVSKFAEFDTEFQSQQ